MKNRPFRLFCATAVCLSALTLAPVAFSEEGDAAEPAPAATETSAPKAEKPKAEAKAAPKAKAVPKYKDVKALKIDEMKKGKGTEAKSGKIVTVHYTGWLVNGTKFDSSVDRGQPFTFNLGRGEVIKGWDEGVAGMKVGGKRRLHIPADKGYGANGAPPVIPPNSTLIFEVELLDVKG